MGIKKFLERYMMASAFAEAGDHDTARELSRVEQKPIQVRKSLRKRPRPRLQAPRF